jgi:hypothetical protein
MKRPTAASLKKVTPENLAALGAERLAAILVAVADARPEVKRRLRMELAAEQGAEHLLVEIDKRLTSLETARSKVSWRQRATFVRELDVLRVLITERLAGLDPAAALQRLWLFMDLAPRLARRVRERDNELGVVFDAAAIDLGALIGQAPATGLADALVEGMIRNPVDWGQWAPVVLGAATPQLAADALRAFAAKGAPGSAWIPLIRRLADAAGDVDALTATYSPAALKTAPVAAALAQRLLAAGRVEEAGRRLEAASPLPSRGLPWNRAQEAAPDFDWESAWIDYLDASGQGEAAQAARWASFERTLSSDRARAFIRRLPDFEDVEAEHRAFDHAASHANAMTGLRFLLDWPALPQAARMIVARADEVRIGGDEAEPWANQLRARHPAAAIVLLRAAAELARRQRDFDASDYLTQEADAIAAEG